MKQTRWLSLAAAAALFPVCALTVSAEGPAPVPGAPSGEKPAAPADKPADKPAAPADKPAAPAPATGETPAPVPAPAGEAAAPVLPADQQAVADARVAMLKTKAEVETAKMAIEQQGQAAYERSEDAALTKEEREKAKAELESLQKQWSALGEKDEAATKPFAEAFLKTDWDKWDLKANQKLIEAALEAVVDVSFDTKPADAVKAMEWTFKHLPGSDLAQGVATFAYPAALVAVGDLAVALTKIKASHAAADPMQKPAFAVWIGDIQCATGSVTEGVATFTEALAALPAGVGRGDPRSESKSELQLRIAMIGKTAPEITSTTVVGGEPKALSALKGSVVVLDFFATWCGPCRRAMPELGALARANAKAGVVVWGVTEQYSNGNLPKTKEALAKGPYERWDATVEGGEGATSENKAKARAEFVTHLTAFHKVADLGYPYVVIEESVSSSYRVEGIPAMYVIGRDGNVAYVQAGYAGNDRLLAASVAAALKVAVADGKPAAAGEPAKAAAPVPPADAPKADAPKGEAPKPTEPQTPAAK